MGYSFLDLARDVLNYANILLFQQKKYGILQGNRDCQKNWRLPGKHQSVHCWCAYIWILKIIITHALYRQVRDRLSFSLREKMQNWRNLKTAMKKRRKNCISPKNGSCIFFYPALPERINILSVCSGVLVFAGRFYAGRGLLTWPHCFQDGLQQFTADIFKGFNGHDTDMKYCRRNGTGILPAAKGYLHKFRGRF